MNKKYQSPFLGEVELIRVGETSRNMMGESVVQTIYVDPQGHYYIDTWTTCGGDPKPMTIISKQVIDKIIEIENEKIKIH